MSASIVPFRSSEPPDLGHLVEESRAEGLVFVEQAVRKWRDGSNRFDAEGEGFFLAREGPLVIGMCGLNIDPYADDPSVGRIRHLYVAPASRRRGVGTALVDACLRLAGDHFRRVGLRTYDPVASRFYEAVGFSTVAENETTHSIIPAGTAG